MPSYNVQTPDGKNLRYDVPDGVTQDQVLAHAQAAYHPPTTIPPTPRAPPPVPVTTKSQDIANAAKKATSEGSWLSSVTQGLESGANSALLGIPSRLAAAARYYLPNGGEAAPGTPGAAGNSNIPVQKSYSDQLALEQQINRNKATNAPVSNIIGNVLGSVAPARAVGRLAGLAATKAAATGTKVGNYIASGLNGAAQLNKGQAIRNVAKSAALGAGVGLAQAAGTGDDVARGAIYGAAGGVGGHVVAGTAGAVGRAIADRISPDTPVIGGLATNAADLLQRYVKATPKQIQQTAAASEAARGYHPTLAEALPADDRGRLAAAMRRMPTEQREQLNSALGRRAGEMGQELSDRTASILAPGQEGRVNNIAQQLADTRTRGAPGSATPTPDEATLAQAASTDPERMQAVRSQVSQNIMAPHDDSQIFPTTDALHPTEVVRVPGAQTQVPTGVLDGQGNPVMRTQTGPDQFTERRSQPQVSDLIDSVTPQAVRVNPNGVRGRDVSNMISRLRDIAGSSDSRADFAAQAADHIESILPPEMQSSVAAMREAHAGNSRLLEGMQAGGKTELRSDATAGIGTDIKAGRKIRNAYDTPEGDAGRAFGQANALASDFQGSPQQVGNAAGAIANTPRTQQALGNNLGAPEAAQITDAASSQLEGARALSGFSTDPTTDTSANLGDMLHNLMSLAPGTLPHTKAITVARVLDALKGSMPAQASSQIVDSLFSQNPASISRGLTLLDRAGDPGRAALKALQAGVSGGAAGSFANEQMNAQPAEPMPQTTDALNAQPGVAIGQAPSPIPDSPIEANDFQPGSATGPIAPDASLGQGPNADPSASPYASVMQQYYSQQAPEMQDLIDRVQQQESGGKQHDKNGNPLTSSAGAIGNMQVLPSTGKASAAKHGIPWDEAAFNHDPAYNKLIGTVTLGDMLDQFDGNVAEATAAYNAGPGNVIKALKLGGNWLSHLPQETQNYVQSVAFAQ